MKIKFVKKRKLFSKLYIVDFTNLKTFPIFSLKFCLPESAKNALLQMYSH